MERQFDARKGAWEGRRKSDNASRFSLFLPLMHREISTSFPSITAHTVKRLRTSLIEVSKHQESHEYKINWSPEGQDMKCINFLLQERTKGICLTFSTIAATLEYDALLYIRIFKGKSGRF